MTLDCGVSAACAVDSVFQVCALHGRLRLTIKDRETLQEELSLAWVSFISIRTTGSLLQLDIFPQNYVILLY